MNDGQKRSAELALCDTFFGTLVNISATLKLANQLLPAAAEPFILAVDSGTSWSCPEGDGSTACYNVPWAGKNQSVARHVLEIADVRATCPLALRPTPGALNLALSPAWPCASQEVALMDYDTDPTAVLSRAKRYLEYADSLGKNGSVRVGLWLAGWNETGAASTQGI